MKKKLAALLRRWAYALNPETPATLPPGFQLAKVGAVIHHAIAEGKMPTVDVVEGYRTQLTDGVLSHIKDCNYIRFRADIAPVPGGMIDYEASLYIGYKPTPIQNRK